MKKILSLLLAMIMVFSLATVAFAAEGDELGGATDCICPVGGETDPDCPAHKDNGEEEEDTTEPTYTDVSTITFKKHYKNPHNGISPAETFSFIWAKMSVTDAGVDPNTGKVVDYNSMPNLEDVSDVSFDEGDAGKVIINAENGTLEVDNLYEEIVTVTLPEYSAVGVYTYLINEIRPEIPTAGVTYHPYTIKLVVTVIEQEGKVRVAAVHTEVDTEDNDLPKNDVIENIYQSGSLAVSKEVIGNAGDKEKEFNVTVEFTAPAREVVKSTISYVEDGVKKTIEPDAWTEDNTASAIIKLKDGETITFTNIPAGITYTVVEASYEAEGYEDAVYAFSNEEKVIEEYPYGTEYNADDNKDTVKITNEKNIAVDTGIALDSAPYFLMLAVAVIGVVALVAKKRYEV